MIQFKGALVLGTLLGATAGVLLAPEKGSITRGHLQKEAKAIKAKIIEDFNEVKADMSKAAMSGKTQLKSDLKVLRSKVSYKTEDAITFLEEKLAIIKQKNKTFQHH